MRVLHIDTEPGWRGGQNQVHLLHRGLLAAGLDSTVVCRAGEALHERCAAEGLPVVPVPAGPGFGLRVTAAIARRRRPDTIVHAHASAAHGQALLAVLGTATPLVVTRRVDFRLKSGPVARWKYGPRITRFVAVSAAIARILQEGGVPAARIRVIHSGVPEPTTVADRPGVRADLGLPADARLVLCPAALVDHKGHRHLFEAWRRLAPDATLLLCGEGERREVLMAQAADLPSVRFLGFRRDLPRLLAASDLAVLSSVEEGLGSVLADCHLHGLPVVATTAGGIPEVVADGVSGLLVPPADPVALADALGRVLGDDALRARLAAGALVQGRKFLIDHTVAAYRALYADLA
jgi:glycosyltransferase involved in cell wall biosynthesis